MSGSKYWNSLYTIFATVRLFICMPRLVWSLCHILGMADYRRIDFIQYFQYGRKNIEAD